MSCIKMLQEICNWPKSQENDFNMNMNPKAFYLLFIGDNISHFLFLVMYFCLKDI